MISITLSNFVGFEVGMQNHGAFPLIAYFAGRTIRAFFGDLPEVAGDPREASTSFQIVCGRLKHELDREVS